MRGLTLSRWWAFAHRLWAKLGGLRSDEAEGRLILRECDPFPFLATPLRSATALPASQFTSLPINSAIPREAMVAPSAFGQLHMPITLNQTSAIGALLRLSLCLHALNVRDAERVLRLAVPNHVLVVLMRGTVVVERCIAWDAIVAVAVLAVEDVLVA